MSDLSKLSQSDWKHIWKGVNGFGMANDLITIIRKTDIMVSDETMMSEIQWICKALYWEIRSDEFSQKLCDSESKRYNQERYTQDLFKENERLRRLIGDTIEPEPETDAPNNQEGLSKISQ